ncbi:MAG: hypothetical protein Q4P18_05710 [Methanobrevibacter sp.]|uniref:hypothetical protein n=1 Tax=Methanobrevibacter sp. TaxID=66852 RepID=UPI0026E112BE|nr:hypothetical protein [Methanobrevibacter sp.]MDO5849009.1 hypothetical protein [Methanobrevibacter sp.]
MNKDNAIVYFCSLVALGIIFIGFTVSYFQRMVALPIMAIGIILFALVMVVNRGHWAHHLENLEKVFFFITIAVICILFIMHFKPF